jgi:hypothetical protein
VAAQCGFGRYEGIERAFLAYLSCRRASIMRLASATISSERLFSRLEGLSAIARVEPGAKIAALQPFPTGLTSMRWPLYSMAVIAHRGSLHFNLKRARMPPHLKHGARNMESFPPPRRKYSPAGVILDATATRGRCCRRKAKAARNGLPPPFHPQLWQSRQACTPR